MLLKYPGLTLAGGLAIAVAIGIGAGWYDLMGKLMAPAIPLPQGDRLVLVETQNILTNEPEPRVARDFLEWRRELRTLEDLGAYRDDNRNLILGNAAPEPIQRRRSRPPRSAPHGCLPCSVEPSSTPTKCQAPPAWSCSATTCGSAPSTAGRTWSGRS